MTTVSDEFVRGWKAALHSMIAHIEGIREDRRLHPPAFRDGRRKFTPDDIVMFERTTASSCKYRARMLLEKFDKATTSGKSKPGKTGGENHGQ